MRTMMVVRSMVTNTVPKTMHIIVLMVFLASSMIIRMFPLVSATSTGFSL